MAKKKMDHRKRFDRWCLHLPIKHQYLITQVQERILPEFERCGSAWYPDFAGNNAQEIGANEIPLQCRNGMEWPTVQITFNKSVWGPFFKIGFSSLPEVCKNPIRDVIPRELAIAVYGPAYFIIRRGVWKDHRDSEFGFNFMPLLLPTPLKIFRVISYLLNWRKFLDAEIDKAIALLPILFDIFDEGIPLDWLDHKRGLVTPNVYLIHSWKLWNQGNPPCK